MAEVTPVGDAWRLTIPEGMYGRLKSHLFRPDHDEHGAVILAGVAKSDRGLRLIARELHLAVDGVDYVPGRYGYRMLKAEFIQSRIRRARDQNLAYLAIHNHGGGTSVSFSGDDMRSHERGYPALLDIARGMPVGALVFATDAVAGDLWFPGRHRQALDHAVIVGKRRQVLRPEPLTSRTDVGRRFDRQARIFGDAGQHILGSCRVGIVGLGGAGSILAELVGRLGVGEILLCDPDVVDDTNLSRLIGADPWDRGWRALLRRGLGFLGIGGIRKVDLAAWNIKRANGAATVTRLAGDVTRADVAMRLADCDYLFLAADSMSARLVVNALVHQYGIPCQQVGVKVPVVQGTGAVGEIFCVARPVTPEKGCLWCNGLINAAKLQSEAIGEKERRQQQYLPEEDAPAPSVVSLNAIACAHAANDFLFYMTGLKDAAAEDGYFRYVPRRNKAWRDDPARETGCLECSVDDGSRLGRGDFWNLPTRST